MNYFTSAVNESKTREFTVSDDLTSGIFTAVELTGDGVATAGESSIPLGKSTGQTGNKRLLASVASSKYIIAKLLKYGFGLKSPSCFLIIKSVVSIMLCLRE